MLYLLKGISLEVDIEGVKLHIEGWNSTNGRFKFAIYITLYY
jgi:hypothetical protein